MIMSEADYFWLIAAAVVLVAVIVQVIRDRRERK
jgi:hypothetical protein